MAVSKKITKDIKKVSVEKKASELTKELSKLVKKLDPADIEFLIKQASIMINNKKLEKSVKENNKKVEKALKKSGSTTRAKTNKGDKKSELKEVKIEETPSGNSFIIVMNKRRNFMTIEEMRKVVKICHLADSSEDSAKRIYGWFQRFRSDVLYDSAIDSSLHPALIELHKLILKTYTLKED